MGCCFCTSEGTGAHSPSSILRSRCSLHRLRKVQPGCDRSLHVQRTKHLFLETSFHGSPQNLRTMTLQDRVQSIHILVPLPRTTMHNLGEIANGSLPQLQQLLPL